MKKKISDRFPVNYGDFVLKSSDGVLFHFSRAILAYMSDFFRGMFELPTPDRTQGTARKPLVVTETAVVLEGLLEQIDPKTLKPAFDNDTIIDVLEAARKYQVSIVLDRFQQKMNSERDLRNSSRQSGLLYSRPLVVLHIALQHEMPEVGRWALRELMRCSAKLIEEDDVEIAVKSFKYIQRLRRERIQYFQRYIDALSKVSPSRQATKTYRPPAPCTKCVTARSGFLIQLDRALEREPSLNTFSRLCDAKDTTPCTMCGGKIPHFKSEFPKIFSMWSIEIKSLEDSKPAWPIP
ncbi:hypothetical protein FRC14_005490 [Serendipita sp. 396]|nr:hypothetical protein FRC14_005490 [Serendipita sp. 396]KAG8779977.1 hypothetical protein FRC15_009815 [Serendipita sp. 397]KAG8820373.1 hypothetical protein FRC19_008935 [Serendipita sp. 401]KAG8866062.1 hypothetical protein FRC20_009112 [Serendipita sp. 405]KAG9023634.1 hypothetical protein FS842_005687 [Serendipita sp. 407]